MPLTAIARHGLRPGPLVHGAMAVPTSDIRKERIRMGKQIVTEADRRKSPAPKASPSYTPPRVGIGQTVSQERGVATRNKKNPGKRPHQGG